MDRGGTCGDRPIRVLLVDDQARVRHALRQLLETYPDIDVVGEAASGEAAIEVTERLDPDVVLMDCTMAKAVSKLSATSERGQREQRRQRQRVVMLIREADAETVARASRGADHLVRGCSAVTLLDAMLHVGGTAR